MQRRPLKFPLGMSCCQWPFKTVQSFYGGNSSQNEAEFHLNMWKTVPRKHYFHVGFSILELGECGPVTGDGAQAQDCHLDPARPNL